MNKYELTVVVSAKLDDEGRTAEVEKVKALIEKFGGYNGKRGSGQYIKMKGSPGYITIYVSDKAIAGIANDDLGWSNN